MDLDWIAGAIGARSVRRGARIQSLWGGYGELFRIEIVGGPRRSAVVKWARPPAGAADVSSARKRRSFDVETAFYRTLAPRCGSRCRVPALLAARGGAEQGEWFLVLEDLDAAGFDRRADEVREEQLDAVLSWLAHFHARFLGERPADLWQTGTYWHLDTRRDELEAIRDRELKAAAAVLAARLAGARFQTLVHGDAKDANFCFTGDGADVAAVDFQYTGPGAGIVDVAYLLYGRADEPEDGVDAARLDRYFGYLRAAIAERDPTIDMVSLETEWRGLYPIARQDFRRFLAGWRRR